MKNIAILIAALVATTSAAAHETHGSRRGDVLGGIAAGAIIGGIIADRHSRRHDYGYLPPPVYPVRRCFQDWVYDPYLGYAIPRPVCTMVYIPY